LRKENIKTEQLNSEIKRSAEAMLNRDLKIQETESLISDLTYELKSLKESAPQDTIKTTIVNRKDSLENADDKESLKIMLKKFQTEYEQILKISLHEKTNLQAEIMAAREALRQENRVFSYFLI